MIDPQAIADSIWRARSTIDGNGQNVTVPIRNLDDAEYVARYWAPDAGYVAQSEIAGELYQRALKAGTAR